MSVAQPNLPGSGTTLRILRDDGVTFVGITVPSEMLWPGPVGARLAQSPGLSTAEQARARNIALTQTRQPREPSMEGPGWAIYTFPGTQQLYVLRDDGTHLSWGGGPGLFTPARAAGVISATPGLSATEIARLSSILGGAVASGGTPTPTPGNAPAVSRPAAYNPTYAINDMGDSTEAGVGAPTGSEPFTQLRALFTGGTTQPFNLQGTTTTVNALYVGNGGTGGQNSAQGLTRVQYVSTNYAGQLPRTWAFSFGLNDYLNSVTPNTRVWADSVRDNYAAMGAIVPTGNDYYLKLTPAEANVSPGQQFSADHVYHRRNMLSIHGWRAISLVRALRLIRQEEGGILPGGADEKALAAGIVPYSYRGTGAYSPIVAGTDFADGDRVPVTVQSTAPSNSTDLAYADGEIWATNISTALLYRKTGASGAGGWAQMDPKHFGRVGYGRIARIEGDVIGAIENRGPPFAPPQEFRVAIDAAPGAAIGTLVFKGTPTAAGIYNLDGTPATQFAITTGGAITRTGTGTLTDGAGEYFVALTNTNGTLHSAVDIYVTRVAGTAPVIRPIAAPGVAIASRASFGAANGTGFSLAMYLTANSISSAPQLFLMTRSTVLGSSPSTPGSPISVLLTAAGGARILVNDSTNTLVANITSTGASFANGVPGWLFIGIDFTNNVRAVFVNDTAATTQAVTAGTIPMSDAICSFLMAAPPNQYYDGLTPLVGGIGYIGFWDRFIDWSVTANRRVLQKADGTPEVRVPFAPIAGFSPLLENFGSKGNWLDGTPDGSNGPQTLSISHRARELMS